MKFFQETIVPLQDEDCYAIAKRLKYEYIPKGQPVRRALDKSTKMFYILAGKVVCSFPQPEEIEERAKIQGIDVVSVLTKLNANTAAAHRQTALYPLGNETEELKPNVL